MSLPLLQERIRDAAARGAKLCLRGGGSKAFYGNPPQGEVLDTRGHTGVVSYEPTELVISARGGTALAEIERVLAASGQCLPFEPPHFGPDATLGGCVAAGLSGPRRASAGALRDFVLGAKLVDGRGELLAFGGQVMKNVAGYDVPRLLAGSLGTLGLIAEVSLKLLPLPECERTLAFDMDERAALETVNGWAAQPLPISASAWHEGRLALRLSGSRSAVESAASRLGGEVLENDRGFWQALREHEHPFFRGPEPLWRVALPSTAAPLGLADGALLEWHGAQRWLKSHIEPQRLRELAHKAGGHATLFRAQERTGGAFSPLSPLLLRIHRELKAAFDPAGVFNPGRMYPEL